MHISSKNSRSKIGMTLVEIMYAMAICVMAFGIAMSIFLSGLRMMYKDTQRLENNITLRSFLSKVSTKAVDSTEFFLFPNYATFDGSVTLTTGDPWPTGSNISQPLDNAFGSQVAHGDCLALIARENTSGSAGITALRIFYRYSTDPNTEASLRLYERIFSTPSTATPEALFNAINLTLAPGEYSGNIKVIQLIDKAVGRKDSSGTNRHPVFASEVPFPTPAQANVSINVEVINGANRNNQLSSSSFNYIISPRK